MNIEIKKVTQCVTFSESERRDSDPRPQPWQGCALPTELLSHCVWDCKYKAFFYFCANISKKNYHFFILF